MATETTKEEVILEFTIDQGKAFDDLTRVRKSMELIKQEQKELQKAYQKGTITLEEYVQEQVRQEQILKKEQKTYADLTKVINTNSNSLDAQRLKLSQLTSERNKLNRSTEDGVKKFNDLNKKILELNESIKKSEQAGGDFRRGIGAYADAIKNAAGQINIAGINVGQLGSQLSSFVNPATAAAGVTAALGAAYAASTTGARDLAFAQNRLSATVAILTEDFGRLVGGGSGGGGGQGPVSRLVSSYGEYLKLLADFASYGIVGDYLDDVAEKSDKAAKATERLRDLEISRAFAAGFGKEDERRAELQRRIRDDEINSLQDRLAASEKINPILEQSAERTSIIIRAQIQAIKESTANYENNREAQLQVAQLEAEILDKQEEITGKLTENVAARKKLQALIDDQAMVSRQGGRNQPGISSTRPLDTSAITPDLTVSDQSDEFLKAQTKLNNDQYLQDARNYGAAIDFKRNAQQQFFDETHDIFLQTSELFRKGSDAQRGFALASIAIDTGEAIAHLAEAAEGNPANAFTFGGAAALQYAAGLIRIFTNIAAAKELVGFSEGGFTGHGDPRSSAGVVHKGEVVWNAEDVARAGGPHAANQMRPTYGRRQSISSGYYDGGVVTNKATNEINQSLALANAMKMMPVPVIGVKQFVREANRVRTKQNQSKI